MVEEDKKRTIADREGVDDRGRFVKGNKCGKGRPPGSKNFSTQWRNLIQRIGQQDIDKELAFDLAEQELIKVAYEKAKEGDYHFYKDIFDRVYGRAQQHIDHTTDGDKIESMGPVTPEIQEVLDEVDEKIRKVFEEQAKNAE